MHLTHMYMYILVKLQSQIELFCHVFQVYQCMSLMRWCLAFTKGALLSDVSTSYESHMNSDP